MAENKEQIALNTNFNPQIIREIVRRHWFLPIIYIILLSTFAFFYLRYTKPIFRSSAKIQIIEEDKVSDVFGNSDQNTLKDNQILQKELELLKSDVLFKNVISRLNLETSIFAEGEILTQDLYRQAPFEVIIYKLKDSSIIDKRIDLKLVDKKIQLSLAENKIGSVQVNQHLDNEYFDLFIRSVNKKNIPELLSESNIYFTINNENSLTKELKSFLNVKIIDEQAKTIEISYEYHNARLCYDVVNEILNEYLQWERDSKQEKVNKTIKFIDTQIDSLSNILRL